MLDQLVDQAWEVVPVDRAMGWLAEVAAHDRYQASHGIVDAAAIVAAAARGIGLRDVTVHRFPADGRNAFWSFRSPVSWTPRRARLRVEAIGIASLVLDHAEQPFLLATYSAPTPPGGVRAPLVTSSAPDWRGAVVLLEGEPAAQADALRLLGPRRALGFIIDGPSRSDAQRGEFSGRVELEGDTALFGFSVTPTQWTAMARAARCGGWAQVELEVDRSAPMPAVTAVLPGGPGSAEVPEVWLTAHLCHPRPGANDNASGVAALLGCAAALRALEGLPGWTTRRRNVRFVWAPEFVGTAAVLRQHVDSSPWPHAVLNLDMVGEDQQQCECPFVVERPPDTVVSPLAPVAEAVVRKVFQHSAGAGGSWRAVPFLGYSDHALFAGPRHACPAVQFTHWPDRFNHSGGDTLDKVSPLELQRSIAAACVLTQCVADEWQIVHAELPDLLQRWCADESAALGARTACLPPDQQSWSGRRAEYMAALHRRLTGEASQGPPLVADGWAARWQGPLNLRAMLASLPRPRRARLEQRVRADKAVLALLSNMAIRADGSRTADEIMEHASFALGRPVDLAVSQELFSALADSGWIARHVVACDRART